METLAPTMVQRHCRIRVVTRHATEFVDLTDRLEALVAHTGTQTGLMNVQTLHTTTAIIVNEHEPLLLDDFHCLLDRTAPADAAYRHDDLTVRTVNLTAGERTNGHAHCRSLLLGPSACLNVVEGTLHLGQWQRVFLVELDGPRTRDVSVLLFGEARP